MLQGATCGGGGSPIADDYIFDKIYAGTATDLNAENALVGYLLGNTNSVTGLTINGMQSANIVNSVVTIKSTDSSVTLTGIVNGGGAASATLTDTARLAAPLTDFSIGVYAFGTGNSHNGFTPLFSSSPYVQARFNSLTVSNGADAPNELTIDSGATVSSGQGVQFTDRGSLKWSMGNQPNDNFEIYDGIDSFQIVNAAPVGDGGNLDLRSQGTGAVNFNDNPGSGTSGVQFFSGGTTPVPVLAITNTGVIDSAAGATLTFHAGAPTTTCGTSPNGSGSVWFRTDGTASTTLYVCSGTTWSAVTVP